MRDLQKELTELTEKCAELQLANASLKQKNFELMNMLPFTNNFEVAKYQLPEPVRCKGQLITHVCYTIPVF